MMVFLELFEILSLAGFHASGESEGWYFGFFLSNCGLSAFSHFIFVLFFSSPDVEALTRVLLLCSSGLIESFEETEEIRKDAARDAAGKKKGQCTDTI